MASVWLQDLSYADIPASGASSNVRLRLPKIGLAGRAGVRAACRLVGAQGACTSWDAVVHSGGSVAGWPLLGRCPLKRRAGASVSARNMRACTSPSLGPLSGPRSALHAGPRAVAGGVHRLGCVEAGTWMGLCSKAAENGLYCTGQPTQMRAQRAAHNSRQLLNICPACR